MPHLALVVEDHADMQARIVELLEPVCVVVGTASDGLAACRAFDAMRPSLVVLDMSLPDMTGLDVARQVRQMAPSVRIVFCTAHDDPALRDATARLGADGYVVKSRMADELVNAVLAITD